MWQQKKYGYGTRCSQGGQQSNAGGPVCHQRGRQASANWRRYRVDAAAAGAAVQASLRDDERVAALCLSAKGLHRQTPTEPQTADRETEQVDRIGIAVTDGGSS